MTQLNPFIAAILPSGQAQRSQSAERVGQTRRTQDLQKNTALHGSDTFEHQVESADAVTDVHDEDRRNPQQRRHDGSADEDQTGENSPEDDRPRLDLTA